jgi:hypothetical protein
MLSTPLQNKVFNGHKKVPFNLFWTAGNFKPLVLEVTVWMLSLA